MTTEQVRMVAGVGATQGPALGGFVTESVQLDSHATRPHTRESPQDRSDGHRRADRLRRQGRQGTQGLSLQVLTTSESTIISK